jgi:hypothetical protein
MTETMTALLIAMIPTMTTWSGEVIRLMNKDFNYY